MLDEDSKNEILQAKNGKEKKKPGIEKHEPLIKPLNRKQYHFSIWHFIAMIFLVLLLNYLLFQPKDVTIDFSEFKEKIESREIQRVEMGEKYFIGYPWTQEKYDELSKKDFKERKSIEIPKNYKTVRVNDPSFITLMDNKGIEYYAKPPENKAWLSVLPSWVFPIALMVIAWNFISKRLGKAGQGVMSFGENKAKLVAEGDTGVTF